jgi:hypothetical protein
MSLSTTKVPPVTDPASPRKGFPMTIITSTYTDNDNKRHLYEQDGNHVLHYVGDVQTECLRIEDSPGWLATY